MTVRSPDDPWYTVLYRDPHTLRWAPGLFVAAVSLMANLLLFDRSALHALVVAFLMGAVITGSAYVRRRRNRVEVPLFLPADPRHNGRVCC